MRWLQFLVFGTGALLAACGSDSGDTPVPNPTPSGSQYCAEQHTTTSGGHEVVVFLTGRACRAGFARTEIHGAHAPRRSWLRAGASAIRKVDVFRAGMRAVG